MAAPASAAAPATTPIDRLRSAVASDCFLALSPRPSRLRVTVRMPLSAFAPSEVIVIWMVFLSAIVVESYG